MMENTFYYYTRSYPNRRSKRMVGRGNEPAYHYHYRRSWQRFVDRHGGISHLIAEYFGTPLLMVDGEPTVAITITPVNDNAQEGK